MIIKGEILLLSSVCHQGEAYKKASDAQGSAAKQTKTTYCRQEKAATSQIRYEQTIEEEIEGGETVNREETSFTRIPVISANAYKNGNLRRNSGQHLLDTIGMDIAELKPNVVQIVFSGGPIALKDKSVNFEDVDKGMPGEKGFKEKLRQILPHVSLFGTSLTTSTMIPGRFDYFGKLYPYCKETVNIIGKKPPYSDYDASEYLGYEYYTRKPMLDTENNDTELGKKYHWRAQVICSGALLGHEIILSRHCTDIEKGALTVAINEFKAKKPLIGGYLSRGLGKVHATYSDLPDPDPYLEYISNNKSQIRDYLIYLNEKIVF